jgi:RND family efflux transporter MFP subunit
MATATSTKIGSILKAAGFTLVMLAAVVGLMMWLMGYFHPKVSRGGQAARRPVDAAQLVSVRSIRVPVHESAVGTVRPVHEAALAAKILARVVAVNMTAGKPVTKGDVLVVLDDEDLKARQQQAAAALESARAARDQAKVEYDRVQALIKDNAAAAIEVERTTTALRSAEAESSRAEQLLKEADTVLAYAKITSPFTGIVVDKRVNVGDTARPGDVLATLYDPTHMQLVARVRESLTYRLKVGQSIPVEVAAVGHPCQGEVSEIVPEAQTASRSFEVKVTGPCPPGVYAGMFGRLLIPLDEEEVVVIPRRVVERVGQLDMVDVADGTVLRRRVVQLGRELGEDVQVLSGLKAGELVAQR